MPDFVQGNVRQYTAESPIYRRLVSSCPQVDDPADAELFVVPFFFSFMVTAGWVVRTQEQREARSAMVRAARSIQKKLPALNETTAASHLFLFSCDSQFVVPLAIHPLLPRSLVVHLGDDTAISHHSKRVLRNATFLPHSLTVPYRVSQWLPGGGANHTVPLRLCRARPVLVSMNVNYARSSARRKIASALHDSAHDLSVNLSAIRDRRQPLSSGRINLTQSMLSLREAAQLATRSVFCVCPTGDSKGFTARFYFSLLHGCLPIRVDGWGRDPTLAPPAFPFPELIDWQRIVLDVPMRQIDSLLPRLLAMSPSEVDDRLRYLWRVAPLLMYDVDDSRSHSDAPAAFLHVLEKRIRARKTETGLI
mmetsp:Transcript_18389/g.58587  ORF Transcript_18389/g.58587 Transcript_18389/m.58587 type:complete len:364 (+) Transcript_18389:181-1272(+)